MHDATNSIEQELAAMKSGLNDNNEKNEAEKEGREKVMEAKIEDLSDRLRFGMNKLQVNLQIVGVFEMLLPFD